MIALLSYSINSLASDNATHSSTGGVQQDSLCKDSILISYCDLRKVNAKLIELEYEKEINKNLKDIIANDSISIVHLSIRCSSILRDSERRTNELKKERNIAGGIGIGAIILLIISLL